MTGATSASAQSRAMVRIACCSRVSSKSTRDLRATGRPSEEAPADRPNALMRHTRSYGSADMLADEADNVLGGGAGGEDLLDAHDLERLDVLGRDDPAAEHGDVVRALFLEQLEHAR